MDRSWSASKGTPPAILVPLSNYGREPSQADAEPAREAEHGQPGPVPGHDTPSLALYQSTNLSRAVQPFKKNGLPPLRLLARSAEAPASRPLRPFALSRAAPKRE